MMGTGILRTVALLVAIAAVFLTIVNGDTSVSPGASNVAHLTTSHNNQQPQTQSIVQPSVVYSSPQQNSALKAHTTAYSVQQSLTVAQPSAVYSPSQQNNARAAHGQATLNSDKQQLSSIQTSASYSVQHSQQQQVPHSQIRNNPSAQQQPESSVAAVTYSQPQSSVYLQPSSSVQSPALQNTQQISFQNIARAQVRSDSGSYVAPTPSQGHYSMGASYQVHGGHHKIPMKQRAAYGSMLYHNNRPIQYRRPIGNWMPNRRQHFEGPSGPPGFHLSAPRPPPYPPKFHSPPSTPSFSGPPRHQQIIYTKPPPEEIYYGPNPPPLDYSPSRPYQSKIIRPIITEPAHFSSPQEPEDHDIMNDLDMYIPDEETPSRVSSSGGGGSAMGSMMMPMMLLGLTLPALGIVFTYLSRRRRRRRDISPHSDEEIDRYLSLLLKALEKSDKSA